MRCTVRHFLHNGIPAKNFAGLMELYECNYIRLRNLVPDVDDMPDYVISRVEGVLDLHLRVVAMLSTIACSIATRWCRNGT
jgi:uncharacterized protein YqiB (DUF1249 family)